MTHCGKLLMCLATTHVEHEIKIETKVVNPLSNISDNDYPNVIKQKKNLTKLILDMDSARTRLVNDSLFHPGVAVLNEYR